MLAVRPVLLPTTAIAKNAKGPRLAMVVFMVRALMVMVVVLVTLTHPYFTLSDHPQCHPDHQPHSRSYVDLGVIIISIVILIIPHRATP